MPRKVRRRIEFTLECGADDWRAVARTLYNLAHRAEAGGLSTSASGGYDSGHILEVDVDESITHESWEKDLEKHLTGLSKEDR